MLVGLEYRSWPTVLRSFTDNFVLSFSIFDLGQIDHLAEVSRDATHGKEK